MNQSKLEPQGALGVSAAAGRRRLLPLLGGDRRDHEPLHGRDPGGPGRRGPVPAAGRAVTVRDDRALRGPDQRHPRRRHPRWIVRKKPLLSQLERFT